MRLNLKCIEIVPGITENFAFVPGKEYEAFLNKDNLIFIEDEMGFIVCFYPHKQKVEHRIIKGYFYERYIGNYFEWKDSYITIA
jgi:hypothetical protein